MAQRSFKVRDWVHSGAGFFPNLSKGIQLWHDLLSVDYSPASFRATIYPPFFLFLQNPGLLNLEQQLCRNDEEKCTDHLLSIYKIKLY